MSSEPSHETRQRILQAATVVFADKGFAQASTREIAKRADVNIASLHYHFGDKAELYRTIFIDMLRRDKLSLERIDFEKASFAEIYTLLNRQFFSHLADQHIPRLAARERLEPSGVLGNEWMEEVRHRHAILDNAIARALGLSAPDVEVRRLNFAITGMVLLFDHGRPIIDTLAPDLMSGPDWVETTLSRLTLYAESLIEAERRRRRPAPALAP